MTFLQTHDCNGHAVLCHNNGNGGDPVYAIFEHVPGSKEEPTVEIATYGEAMAYCQKYSMNPLSVVNSC